MQNKIIRALLISTGLLIMPFTASLFVDGWNWSGFDYLFAWVLFSFVSLAITFAVTSTEDTSYKVAIGLAAVATFLLIWINGAVQIIGDVGDLDTPDGLYAGVIVIGLIGTILARFQPRGMSRALFAMAIAQFLVPVIGYIIWPPAVFAWTPSVPSIFVLNSVWVLMFVVSGLLFRRASDMGSTEPTA